MASNQRESGNWDAIARAGKRCLRSRNADREFAHKLLGVVCAVCMVMLIAPSAFAEELSIQTAIAPRDTVAVDGVEKLAPTGAVARVELEAVVPSLEYAHNPIGRHRIDEGDRFVMAPELRSRVWWGTPIGGLGTGVDLSATATVTGLQPMRLVMGVRANMSERTRLIYEVRGPATSPAAASSGAGDSEARLALEFRSAKSAAQQLRNGLFRIQLSNSSSLLLKPRSGGLVVSYRSQF